MHMYLQLVEGRTLWGEPERVHVQNMEQLHAYDHCQNVTEHKPQATVYDTKSTDIRSCSCTTQNWVRLARPAGMTCLVCMVAACTWDVSILRWHCCHLLWHAIALIDAAIGEVGECDEWLPLWVAMQIMALTDETFLPWGSPYCSSHWRGRSTSGSRTCYCQ